MLRDQLRELLAPVVAGLGYQLWELEYLPRSGGGMLRLYIDSADEQSAAGISLDDCERVSRGVSETLDAADPIPGHYTLEVSSPGLDRVLRTPAHFARFVGDRVWMELKVARDGRRRYTGQLMASDGEAVELNVDGAIVRVPIDEISRARLAPQ